MKHQLFLGKEVASLEYEYPDGTSISDIHFHFLEGVIRNCIIFSENKPLSGKKYKEDDWTWEENRRRARIRSECVEYHEKVSRKFEAIFGSRIPEISVIINHYGYARTLDYNKYPIDPDELDYSIWREVIRETLQSGWEESNPTIYETRRLFHEMKDCR